MIHDLSGPKAILSCERNSSEKCTTDSGGVWERLHYDWSDPHHVVLSATNSNLWGGDSGHTYTFTRTPGGTTDIDVDVIRQGKNLKGRFLGLVLGGGKEGSQAQRNGLRLRMLRS